MYDPTGIDDINVSFWEAVAMCGALLGLFGIAAGMVAGLIYFLP